MCRESRLGYSRGGGCGSRFMFKDGLSYQTNFGDDMTPQEISLNALKESYLDGIIHRLHTTEGWYNNIKFYYMNIILYIFFHSHF